MRQTESLNQEKPGPNRIFGNRKLQITLTLTFGLIVSCSAVAFISRAHSQPASESTMVKATDSTEPAPSTRAAQDDKDRIRTERVTAFSYGLEPDEITRPEGLFMLCVDNRAGTEALSLQLVSEMDGPVVSQSIRKGTSGTHQMLNLRPGRYLLIEDSHPKWTCTLTITAR
jgi:hypothetical protein